MAGRESAATEAAILLVNSGQNYCAAAKAAGISRSTLVRAMRRRGVQAPPVAVPNPDSVAAAVGLHQAGVNVTAAARLAGVTRPVLERALRRQAAP